MLKEFRGRVDEHSKNFNKEIENIKTETENIIGNQSEMKNTISEMTRTLEGINRVDVMEDQISDIEGDGAEDTQSE